MTRPADEGLQAERTALAWRRTALSVSVGSLASMRVLPDHLGRLAYVVCVAGLVWSADLAWTASRRYAQADAQVRAQGTCARSGASVCRTAVTAGGTALLALATIVVIAR